MTMPSDTETSRDQHRPQPVHVAIYEHPHGTDVRVFLDKDQAMNWRTGLAKEWWSNAYEDDPPPDDEIGEEYFERMQEHGDEFFSVVMCDIDISHPVPAAPGSLAPDSEDGGAAP